MAVKKNVFASKSERNNYYKLEREWGHKLTLYHNLPFLNVFSPTNLYSFWASDARDITPFELTEQEINRLKKTSIDYTLCDGQDRPVLCIEYDGMESGYNVRASYHSRLADPLPPDPWRKIIMELKLKVAFGSMFPFFVVSSQEFADLSPDLELTIVDGIVGDVLKSKVMSEKFAGGFDPEEIGLSREDFDSLPPDEQHEIVQDWALGVEVEAEMTHNPITYKAADLMRELSLGAHKIEDGTIPNLENTKSLQERLSLLESAMFHSRTCTFFTDDLGDISATAYLPNYQSVGCGFLTDLACLLAALKVKRLREAAAKSKPGR